MKAIIRIHGRVGLNRDIVETFKRLNLKRKYSCVILAKPTKVELGMIKKLRNFVAYGDIDKDTLSRLLEKRGKLIDKKKKTDTLRENAQSILVVQMFLS